MKIKIKFKLNDFWIGAFWESYKINNAPKRQSENTFLKRTDIYICIVPCFPICISYEKVI